jgi:hypothetical protein
MGRYCSNKKRRVSEKACLECTLHCPATQYVFPKKTVTPSFNELVMVLKTFKLTCAPFNEAEIENGIEQLLKKQNFPVQRQVFFENGRFDITVGEFIIEAKVNACINIVEQLDRYSSHCNGIILLCWKATAPLKSVFNAAKLQSLIPVELVEITKNCDVA